jgi:hypothetical protein
LVKDGAAWQRHFVTHCTPDCSGIGFENSTNGVLMPVMTLRREGGMGFASLPQAGGGTFYAAHWLREFLMSAQDMVKLIEELIEIKVRQNAIATAKNLGLVNKELGRVMYEANAADRDRLQSVRQLLVQVLEGT